MDRLAVLAIVGSTIAAGCAATRDDIQEPGAAAPTVAVTAAEPAGDPAAPEDVRTVEVAQLDDEPVCEQRRRAGSRISKPVCYTPEQRAALQAKQAAAARDYAQDLERERAMKEQQSRQSPQQPSIIVFQ